MFCPFNTNACGDRKDITLTNEGQEKDVTITNLQKGETCMYVVRAKCGAPAVALPQAVSGVEVAYI